MVPVLNKKFVCIVDRKRIDLAAMISSYFVVPGEYFPLFEFPVVTIVKPDIDEDDIDEHIVTRMRANEFNMFVGNCIARNGGCDHLILAGLSEEQKSYLTFINKYNIIEIADIGELDFLLGSFVENNKGVLLCRSDQLLDGLNIAIGENLKLVIDDAADLIELPDDSNTGLIVIEKIEAVSTVVAVNYAASVKADIKIVEPLGPDEEKEVLALLEEWQSGIHDSYYQICEKVNKRVDQIYFPAYDYVTFFTNGLPYSLVINNDIPCTYVHLLYRPDVFIFHNILFEDVECNNAAIVFSPKLFKAGEESEYVSKELQKKNFYVRELFGKEATVYNLDMNVKEFPYDLLHICSHGGEVGGYSITETFKDRDGVSHIVEYDEVVGFAPNPYMNKPETKFDDIIIPVHRKMIFRKFDGFAWRSKEFKAKNYPRYLFADMQKEMDAMFRDANYKPERLPVDAVSGSCGITCTDSVYQAMIQFVAGAHTAPIIFNNSCWSWSGIADSFLVGGVRGYIGTLWKVDNGIATQVAEDFYSHVFNHTIVDALRKATEITKGSDNENIYVYWGLHFSKLKKGAAVNKSREHVCHKLLQSFYRWIDQKKNVKSGTIAQNIMHLANWNMSQIRRFFAEEFVRIMTKSAARR
ncbi:MAG: hypothetical protein ACTHMC_07640 [Pseudobacter sp.]|uniref:hypothetical protein n=1 Tax=Pseudobacter sp. TaxID=2045420 RepID=UPI003F8138D4